MLDPKFRPGLDQFSFQKELPIGRDGSWLARAAKLVDDYANNGFPVDSIIHKGNVHGWIKDSVLNVVVHPLWDGYASDLNPIGEIHELAAALNLTGIRRIDSFNLSRRMVWVRANLHNDQLYLVEDIVINSTSVGPVTVVTSDFNQIASYDALIRLDEGSTFSFDDKKWQKIRPKKVSKMIDGEEFIAVTPSKNFVIIKVSKKRGMQAPNLRTDNGTLNTSAAEAYKFVAQVIKGDSNDA
jgi:DEAD/DEAH box helicase domain-containing protein